jgi:DNA-binding LacI/PurR family transcriptional regulator
MSEATIRDVARHAEVSVATVSRALNGLDNVREQTKQRIMEAAKTLGYVPHAGARSLSLSRTNAIGVVLPDLHGEFFSEIVRGMDREASRSGYLLLLSNMHGRREQATLAMRAMHGRVDALVGFDDIPLAKHIGLTTVRVRIAELGERALSRLLAALATGDSGGEELHAPELVVRATTGAGPDG